ncbi:solute carrier family 22 member 4 [Anabrus simplex]|uniref:solute carrier family 22 member 4 n=1 Tax=Anabrus simplex TaxID=316456 RepID=UPI0034DCF7CF
MAETDLDKILEELGQFGRFQIVSYVLISIPMIFVVISGTSFVFTSGDLDYRCRIPECDGNNTAYRPEWIQNAVPMEQRAGMEIPHRCLRYEVVNITSESGSGSEYCPAQLFDNTSTVRCDEWIFDGNEYTIVNEWNITCEENKWKLTVAGTLVYTGALLSKPFAGFVSDRFGRKVLLLGGLALASITGAIRGLSNSLVMFQVCNLMEGIFGGGIYSAAFVMGKYLKILF